MRPLPCLFCLPDLLLKRKGELSHLGSSTTIYRGIYLATLMIYASQAQDIVELKQVSHTQSELSVIKFLDIITLGGDISTTFQPCRS